MPAVMIGTPRARRRFSFESAAGRAAQFLIVLNSFGITIYYILLLDLRFGPAAYYLMESLLSVGSRQQPGQISYRRIGDCVVPLRY